MMRSMGNRWTRTAVVVAAASLFAVPAGAAKTVTWDVAVLKSSGTWKLVTPNWLTKRGEMAGLYSLDPALTAPHAVRWRSPDAEAEPLAETPGSQYSYVIAMNDKGQMAGVSGDHAVIWDRDGTIHDLHDRASGAKWSVLQAIGSRGDAVGVIGLAADDTERGAYWPKEGPARTLPLDGTEYLGARAVSMNDRGTVCGYGLSLPNGAPYRAAYWPKGGDMVSLHTKITEAMPTAAASMALKVLGGGQVAGVAWEPFVTQVTVMKSWVFDPRRNSIVLVDDGALDSVMVWAGSGSNLLLGAADGTYFDVINFSTKVQPALWRRTRTSSGTTWALTTGLPMPAGYLGGTLVSCNRSGTRLVGAATAADGTTVGVYYTRSGH
jgi:hypothetical protein